MADIEPAADRLDEVMALRLWALRCELARIEESTQRRRLEQGIDDQRRQLLLAQQADVLVAAKVKYAVDPERDRISLPDGAILRAEVASG